MKVIVDGIAVVNVDSIVVIPDLTFDQQSGKVISRYCNTRDMFLKC